MSTFTTISSFTASYPKNEIIKSQSVLKSGFIKRWRTSDFWVKLTNWEYWDFGVVYALTSILHLYQSIKARSFFYFSAANPGLENSGFIGETKSSIMSLIPKDKQPEYFLVDGMEFEAVLQNIENHEITFPLIAKPNVGERGQGVAKIHSSGDLKAYHQKIGVPYLVQAFVGLPLELGLFYYRLPDVEKGTISSIVVKDFLTVEGNGKSTLAELIEENPRSRFVTEFLSEKFASIWNEVLGNGEKLELEGIGNHCRGTTFLNGNHIISEQLTKVFDDLSQSIPGFYFGRYDLRSASVEALEKGEFQILELNGAGAEPAHIYQPGFSFWEGQRVLLHHWKVLYRISKYNHSKGVSYWNLNQALDIKKKHKMMLSKIGL